MFRKLFLVVLALSFLMSASEAIKVHELPLVSDAHLGFVSGIGGGMNLGFDAGFDFIGCKIGPEVELVITDVDYAAAINGKRFGLFINYAILDTLELNLHAGALGFEVTNRDVYYSSNGSDYMLAVNNSYNGQYLAFSLDFLWAGFIFSPKYVINTIEGQGSLAELDFNIGRKFL